MSSDPAPAVEPPDEEIRYHVEQAGLQISTPIEWTSGSGFDGALAVFEAPHPQDTPFTSTLTVITRPRDPADVAGNELADQARALLELDDALLLESAWSSVGDRPAAWAVVAYTNGEFELTLEQWIVASEETVVALSATVLTIDYGYDAGLYEDIVGSVAFDG
jgi:hypothetical protein